jgi:hypothetical protein
VKRNEPEPSPYRTYYVTRPGMPTDTIRAQHVSGGRSGEILFHRDGACVKGYAAGQWSTIELVEQGAS